MGLFEFRRQLEYKAAMRVNEPADIRSQQVERAHARVISLYLDICIILACMTDEDAPKKLRDEAKTAAYRLNLWSRQLGARRSSYTYNTPDEAALEEDFKLLRGCVPGYAAQFEQAVRWARRAPELSLLEVVALVFAEDGQVHVEMPAQRLSICDAEEVRSRNACAEA